MLRRGAIVAGCMVLAGSGRAQMHKVAKPETVVRAVGVYEWTGDLAHPEASRLVPIALYIDQKLEDAALYLARPVPFALVTGNIYELEDAGVAKGTVELDYARHLQAAGTADAYDDGWFGYGRFKAPYVPKEPVSHKLQPTQLSVVETGSSSDDAAKAPEAAKPADDTAAQTADPDRPHFSNKNAPPQDAPAKSDAKKDDPADDPDRPTMKRRSDSAASADSASQPDDPERPTLKRRSPEAKAKAASAKDEGLALNDDPDRPSLHRGNASVGLREADLKKLAGLPADLHQMIAVSDAKDRPLHVFARPWEDDAERATALTKMRNLASAQLATYTAGPGATAPASPNASPAGAPRRTPNSKLKLPVHPVQALSTTLQDEQLKGFLLSYGDVPTFVYQAHTEGTGAALRYVTVVAQRDAQGEPKIVLASVTDETHLDRAARLRLIDAVDVDASNRASLLFEMRGQTSRQFAVYRVLGLRAQQIFTTGTTQ